MNQPKYNANHTLGHPRAGSDSPIAIRSRWGAHGSQKGSKNRVFGIRFYHFPCIFLNSILHVFYDHFFNNSNDLKLSLKRVNASLDRLVFGQLIKTGVKYHQNGRHIQPKYNANHTLGHQRAGSDSPVVIRSRWAAHGSQTGPRI